MNVVTLSAATALIARCLQLRESGASEAVLRAEFQSRLRSVFPDPRDESWVNHYSEGTEAHTRVGLAGGGIASRFIDTLIRSTVIEYEPDLRPPAAWQHGYEQVREYVAGAVREGAEVSHVRGVLSDTVDWFVFDAELAPGTDPLACTPADIVLQEVERFSPTAPDAEQAERLALFLKKHLAREQSRELTSSHIALDLGLESLPFLRHENALVDLVRAGRSGDPSVALATELWSRFVDSLEPHEEDFRATMYVDEVYVGVLARLLAVNVLESRALLSGDDELRQILSGEHFSTRFRLRNMVEDDYFGWLVRAPYLARVLPVARDVQADLYAYDFARIGEPDLFGRLMAQLARRSQRKFLGQEWTPGWLARELASRCLKSIPASEDPRVIDMCCGSGAIVAEVIRAQRERKPTATLGELTDAATGFDIDPLAVALAKTTWVVALAPLLQRASHDVTIPIYHADSLFAVTPVTARVPAPGEPKDFAIDLDGASVDLPRELIAPGLRPVFDDIVDWCYDEARDTARDSGRPLDEERAARLVASLVEKHRVEVDDALRRRIIATTFGLARRMAELARANRNGIWAFILRNTYRPGLLVGQFNGLVSNPPWLAMSQIAENPYKEQLTARAQLYGVNPGGASHLHLELATTFLLHATDRYLKTGASIACLVPGTVFNGHHHQKFRDGAYLTSERPVAFELHEVWEIEAGTFKVRSAAVVGTKKASPKEVAPVPRGFYAGPGGRQEVAFEVLRLGQRTAWVLGGNAAPLGAPVTDAVPPQGADLMPRTAVVIEIQDRSGAEWRVGTPARGSPLHYAVKDAKKLKGVEFPGYVAPQFIYRMVQSLNLVPFLCIEPFASVALPARRLPSGEWEFLDVATIRTLGFQQSARRFERIDQAVAEAKVVRRLVEKIDERNKLSAQVFRPGRYLVLSGAGGGVSCGACLHVSGENDLVIDQTLYWRLVPTPANAWYLVGLLNSDAITEAIRPFVPQGEFGERHLHTLPHRVIPRFDLSNEDHMEIAALAGQLSAEARRIIGEQEEIADLSRPIATRRRKLRTELQQYAAFRRLEELCAAVLGTTPTSSPLTRDSLTAT